MLLLKRIIINILLEEARRAISLLLKEVPAENREDTKEGNVAGTWAAALHSLCPKGSQGQTIASRFE